MIDFRGPLAGHVEPRQSMRSVAPAIDPDQDPPINLSAATGYLPYKPFLASELAPSEHAGFRIVKQQFPEALGRQTHVSVLIDGHGLMPMVQAAQLIDEIENDDGS